MAWQRWWLAAGLSAAMLVKSQGAYAAPRSACSSITRSNLVACAVDASLARQAGQASVAASEGRIAATAPWFPSAPTLALSGARRQAADDTAFNWSATLGVELELAGQRAARRTAAVADREAETKNVEALERATAARAWRVYFEVLGSVEALALLQRLELTSHRVWEVARASAERGALAGVEADLAEAAHVRVIRRRIDAEREAGEAKSELAVLVGVAQGQEVAVEGLLEPLREAERINAANRSEPPEATALEAEGRAFSARAAAQRRSRVPSPTLSVFAERDGFNENVLGVGVAFPLPLPEPLGRLHAGEIAENEALSRRARLLAADARRNGQAELRRALARYHAAREATLTYTEERVARSMATLMSLAAQVEAGRISTRDAIVLQDPLFDLLIGAVEARRLLCGASADLARAAGVRLEDGSGR
jgi:cobalt-zinc-cadmium efflux system outer membrane protein